MNCECFAFTQGETVAEAFPLGFDPSGKRFAGRFEFLPSPLDLTSDDGGLTTEGDFLVVNIPWEYTAGIRPGLYYFDVFATSQDGDRTRVESGLVRVKQAATPAP